jgi:hypothetical protein
LLDNKSSGNQVADASNLGGPEPHAGIHSIASGSSNGEMWVSTKLVMFILSIFVYFLFKKNQFLQEVNHLL